MIKIKCKTCGKEILTYKCKVGRKKYCSKSCMNDPRRIFKKCKTCGKTFKVWRKVNLLGQGIYCSRGCMKEDKNNIKICLTCGKTFYSWKSLELKNKGRFCNRKCYAEYQKTIIGDKTNAYNSLMVKCKTCGKKFLKPKSHIWKNNYCSNKCGNIDYSKIHNGKNSHTWKGGKTKLSKTIRCRKKYDHWRYEVFTRDKFTCQDCGRVGGDLNAHHIKEFALYPELRHEASNGITLCKPCHRKKHKHKF